MRRSLAFGLVLLQTLLSRPVSHAEPLPRESLERLHGSVQILMRSSTGRSLVDAAKSLWGVESEKEMTRFLKWGRASRTDAVLIRHFDPATGAEKREREVTVALRSDQRLQDVVLDLAHELSHAVSKPVWDPYDPTLTAGDYLYSSLEGRGGEIEAVGKECLVAIELSPLIKDMDLARCEAYLAEGKIDSSKILADFYRVGNWYPRLTARLGAETYRFPMLSAKAPKLFSSTGHSPYPVALYEEFEQINSIACENSRVRLHSLSSRSPASSLDPVSVGNVRAFIKKRCQSS